MINVKGDHETSKRFYLTHQTEQDSLTFFLPLFCLISLVPSRPPQNLWANNISSTALITKWNPVPLGFVHGILWGYRVLYKEKNNPSAQYTIITVPPGIRRQTISNLKKFTYYTIWVLAFTIRGDGALSPPMNVTTDEDSKYKRVTLPRKINPFFSILAIGISSRGRLGGLFISNTFDGELI